MMNPNNQCNVMTICVRYDLGNVYILSILQQQQIKLDATILNRQLYWTNDVGDCSPVVVLWSLFLTLMHLSVMSPRGEFGIPTGFDIFLPNCGQVFPPGAQSCHQILPLWKNSLEFLKEIHTNIIKSVFIEPWQQLDNDYKMSKRWYKNCNITSPMIQKGHFQNSVVGNSHALGVVPFKTLLTRKDLTKWKITHHLLLYYHLLTSQNFPAGWQVFIHCVWYLRCPHQKSDDKHPNPGEYKLVHCPT